MDSSQSMAAASEAPPTLDDRHLDTQLPAGLSRGDEAAIDAVMQLAAFTEQQHHQQQQHEQGSPGQEGAGASQDSKGGGRKRKANSAAGAGKTTSDKIRKEDGDGGHHLEMQGAGGEDDSQQQHNWASFSGQNNEFEHLLQQEATGGGDESQNQSISMDQQQQMGDDGSGEILTRHGRPLSTTKRAAQNRAAQRAFRERRDQHFKDVEAKAKQVDEALASAAMHKQRYEDLLRTIAGLRQDNQSLRMAINALGGNPPPPPPAATAFPSINGEGDIANWLQDLNGEQPEMEQPSKEGNGDGHLEGLSAVAAAAAAAAAAHAVGQEAEEKAPPGDERDEAAAVAAAIAEQAR